MARCVVTGKSRRLRRGHDFLRSIGEIRGGGQGQTAGAEHRAALLHGAARWIDEAGRDLAPVVREGNFGKVFPFGALIAEAEAAFRVEPLP